MVTLTCEQARRFLLLRHGLLGRRMYKGKEGVLAVFEKLRAVQYDPVNICGRSPEISLLARVEGYKPQYLYDLLYRDRVLVDHYDKCMCIFPIEDFRYFRRIREGMSIFGRRRAGVEEVFPQVLELAHRLPHICSKDIGLDEKIPWPWGATSVGRAAAERLYFEGQLVVHHKEGVVRHYTLPEKVGVEGEIHAADPNGTDRDFFRWLVRRRLYAIGMMEDRPGDGFLGVSGLTAAVRRQAFRDLLEAEEIFPAELEGRTWYVDVRDRETLAAACDPGLKPTDRCALLAPLDSLLWDRKTIHTIFGFDYKWEIYTPEEKRVYGAYVLPVLWRDRLVSRIEPIADRKAGILTVRRFWPEPGFKITKAFEKALERELDRLAGLNGVALCKPVF
ncbi:MAG: YcaQ family DNA glycosylase [Clostridia bacterium]|nr:YcaQ family DNA glycosylase [Clostridia bacterium]